VLTPIENGTNVPWVLFWVVVNVLGKGRLLVDTFLNGSAGPKEVREKKFSNFASALVFAPIANTMHLLQNTTNRLRQTECLWQNLKHGISTRGSVAGETKCSKRRGMRSRMGQIESVLNRKIMLLRVR
jgi:hypothetical protein